MRRYCLTIFGILVLLVICPSTYAPEATETSPESTVKAKADDRLPIQRQDQWQFFLSPYFWIPGINANISTLKGTVNPVVPWWEAASDLFSKTIGIMGRAEAWKGRWGGLPGWLLCLPGRLRQPGGSQ